jgi:hypothetical protein
VVNVHLHDGPEDMRPVRAKAWELIKSRTTSGGEFEDIIFSDFVNEALEAGPEFTLGVLGELRRIAATILVNVAKQTGQSLEAVAEWANESDERSHE